MQDSIVIGEGVVLDARPASFVTRTLGALLDIVALVMGAWLLTLVSIPITVNLDPSFAAPISIAMAALAMLIVPTTVETLTRGRSLGKLATGVRIVRDDGGPIRFRHAFVRALLGIFELWLTAGSVAIITSLCNDKGKRLGDIAAGTYAIRIRGGGSLMAPVFMPPHLAAWAATADMRRLPDGLALAARQFLARAPKLHPASRVRLGEDLAARTEQFVAPGPPIGTPPEVFLVAVLAERRNREWVRSQDIQRSVAAQSALVQRLPYSIPDPRH